MEGKGIENRVYQIVIVCLLVVLVIFAVKEQTGLYQISGDKVLNTKTGETYILRLIQGSDGESWVWGYLGVPKKTFDYEKLTEAALKRTKERR